MYGYIYMSMGRWSMFPVALTSRYISCTSGPRCDPTPTGQRAHPSPPPAPAAPRMPTNAPTACKVCPSDPRCDPRAQAIERTGELVKSLCPAPCPRALSSDPPARGGPSTAPSIGSPGPRASGKVPSGPRASPLQLPSARRPRRPTPPPRQLAPHAPSPGPRSTTGSPSPRGWGRGTTGDAWFYVGTGVPGRPTARVTLPGPPP